MMEWPRDMANDNRRMRKDLEAAHAEIERLQELLRGVGANRYWEGRWRDEAAENEKLRVALKECAADYKSPPTYPHGNEQGLTGSEVPRRTLPSRRENMAQATSRETTLVSTSPASPTYPHQRLFTMWHMHRGPYGHPRAMSQYYIPCRPLWFWEDENAKALAAGVSI